MRILFRTLGTAVLCASIQPVLAETTAEAAGEVRQAVRIEAPSELPTAVVAPEAEGGAGLALPEGVDEPKLAQEAVAQAPAAAPIPAAEATPDAVMPACDDPRSVKLEDLDGRTALVALPICADQVRLSLVDRDGAIVKPEFSIVDRTLRAELPCGRVFKEVKLMVGFQPVSVGLVPREIPCQEQVTQVAMPVQQTTPEVASSGCGASFDGAVADGILTAGFAGCTEGEVVGLTYQGHSFNGTALADGTAQVAVPLLTQNAVVQTADGAEHTVSWPEAARTIRVVLAWDAAVDLDLYVLEPGVSYEAFETAPHSERGQAAFGANGRMVVTSGANDATRFEVYDSPQSSGPQGMGTVVLSNVSRGMSPSGDFCGEGALAGPDFRVMLGGAEQPRKVRFAFEKAECGSTLDSGQYYRRVDDIHPFW